MTKKLGEPFGLCISIFKLRQLVKNKGGIVTHPMTPRWIQFFEKQRVCQVRFYALPHGESHVFSIKCRRKRRQLGEDIIEIECYEQGHKEDDKDAQTRAIVHDK